MKYKITELLIGDMIRYTVQKRKHWYNKWTYIYDGAYPKLFTGELLEKLGLVYGQYSFQDIINIPVEDFKLFEYDLKQIKATAKEIKENITDLEECFNRIFSKKE